LLDRSRKEPEGVTETGNEGRRPVDGVVSTIVMALCVDSDDVMTVGGLSPCSLVRVLNGDGAVEPVSDANSLSFTDVRSDMVSRESRFSTTSWRIKIGMPAPCELATLDDPLNLLNPDEVLLDPTLVVPVPV